MIAIHQLNNLVFPILSIKANSSNKGIFGSYSYELNQRYLNLLLSNYCYYLRASYRKQQQFIEL